MTSMPERSLLDNCHFSLFDHLLFETLRLDLSKQSGLRMFCSLNLTQITFFLTCDLGKTNFAQNKHHHRECMQSFLSSTNCLASSNSVGQYLTKLTYKKGMLSKSLSVVRSATSRAEPWCALNLLSSLQWLCLWQLRSQAEVSCNFIRLATSCLNLISPIKTNKFCLY